MTTDKMNGFEYDDENGGYRDEFGNRGAFCEECERVVDESEHAGDRCFDCEKAVSN